MTDNRSMGLSQKILMVDDEQRNLRILSEMLEGRVQLASASNGTEALEILPTFKPDLILLDLMMAGMDGYEVCRRIRASKQFSHIKIILVSGRARVEERLAGYAAGADDYMTKPFVVEELDAKINVFLRLCAAEKEVRDLNQSLENKVAERTRQLYDIEGKLVSTARIAALGEMAGGIAHEINSPLCTIRLISDQLSELLKDRPADENILIQKAQLISNTAQRIGNIISGLRTFSRDGSKDPFHSVAVNQLVSDTLSLCGEKLRYLGVKLDTSGLQEGLHLECRAVEMSQVLFNLISNSLEAVSFQEDKWICISSQSKNGVVTVTVTDSGKGLRADIRHKVFQPFFTTKDIGEGMGLGLSVSKGAIESHGGTLMVDDSCANTRFVLTVPEFQKSRSENVA